jgi:hypothetical protein
MLLILGDASHNIYGWNSSTFSSLTNQQKVDIIDKAIRDMVIRLSKDYKLKIDTELSLETSKATYTMQ